MTQRDNEKILNDLIADESFIRYARDPAAHPDDAAYWRRWTAEHPEYDAVAGEAAAFARAVDFPMYRLTGAEKRALQHSILKSIDSLPRQKTVHLAVDNGRAMRRNRLIRGLAAALIPLAVATFYFQQRTSPTVHRTEQGEKLEVLLPDNTVVILNANSALAYDEEEWLESGEREVRLEGEAYFSVRKVESRAGFRRFTVHTRDVDVEVLGTEFNVSERTGRTRVTLNSGKVLLKAEAAPDEGVVMEPGEQVVITDQKIERRRVDPRAYSSWKDNEVTFVAVTLQEVASVLEDTYGVEVAFGSARIGKLVFTGSAPVDKLDLLLESIARSFSIDVEREGDRIVFSEKRSAE